MGKKAAAAATPPPAAEEEEVPEEEPGELKEGDFIFQDGSTYVGSYMKKGDEICIHGEGLMQSGPEVFEGTFEKGQYKEGTYKSCNGAIYIGHFFDNKFHGLGQYTWNAKMPDERTYIGMFRNGYMHGCGQYMNFSFGVHKNFKGFSFRGRFSSAREEQEDLKTSFMAEYGTEYYASASSALKQLAEKTTTEMPERYLVPNPPTEEGEEEKPENVLARAQVEELVAGPFPPATAVPPAALQAFAARLDPEAEKPLKSKIYDGMAKDGEQAEVIAGRLRHEQLQHVGQAVEFEASDAEVGAVRVAVLVNISNIFDVSAAKWKLVHIEEVPAPA